ncbi:MAG: hypothetical protein HY908_13295 [Myxococcales bacterium]|nr:hypothetical protein [Myxococcales bacterium]
MKGSATDAAIADERPPRRPWGRLAVTLLGALAYALGDRFLAVPGIDLTVVEPALPPGDARALRGPGPFALGIAPWVVGIALVELVATLVPPWRALRGGGDGDGRATLRRVALFVGVALAVAYAFAVVSGLGALGLLAGSRAVPVLTLAAGSALLCWLAGIVTRHGLGNGFLVMFAAGFVPGFVESALALRGPLEVAVRVGATALVAGAAYLACAPPRHAHRAGPAEAPRGPTLPWLAAGALPLALAVLLVSLPDVLASLGLPVGSLRELVWGPAVTVAFELGALAVLCPLCAFGFNRLGPVVSAWWRLAPGSAPAELRARARWQVMHGAVRSFVLLGTAVLVVEVGSRLRVPTGPLTAAMLVAVIAGDLVAEWRARAREPELVAVWGEERPWALPVAERALAARGIPCHVRSARSRTFLQLFAAFAPMDVHVPAGVAKRARRVLVRVLGQPALSEQALASRATVEAFGEAPRGRAGLTEPLAPSPLRPKAAWLLAGFALAAIAVLALVPHRRATTDAEDRPDYAQGPLPGLELVLVDDESDSMREASLLASLPEGVSIHLENAPVGPGRNTVSYFARIERLGDESLAACAGRARAWLDELAANRVAALETGRRFALAEAAEVDPLTGEQSVTGYRTYVLRGTAILTGTDFAEAAIGLDEFEGQSWAHVQVRLTPEAAGKFEQATAANVKRRMAIVVAGDIASVPVINERISGGTMRITMGAGTPEQQVADARRLVARMKGR